MATDQEMRGIVNKVVSRLNLVGDFEVLAKGDNTIEVFAASTPDAIIRLTIDVLEVW